MKNIELKGSVWKSWFNWLAMSNQFDLWLDGGFTTQGISK